MLNKVVNFHKGVKYKSAEILITDKENNSKFLICTSNYTLAQNGQKIAEIKFKHERVSVIHAIY